MREWKLTKNNKEYQEYTLMKKITYSFIVDKEDLKNDDNLLDYLKTKGEERLANKIVLDIIGDYLKEEATKLHKELNNNWLRIVDNDKYKQGYLNALLVVLLKLGVDVSEYA